MKKQLRFEPQVYVKYSCRDVSKALSRLADDLTQATLQVLQHSLKLLADIKIENFVAEEEYCQMLLRSMEADDLKKMTLRPLQERYILKIAP